MSTHARGKDNYRKFRKMALASPDEWPATKARVAAQGALAAARKAKRPIEEINKLIASYKATHAPYRAEFLRGIPLCDQTSSPRQVVSTPKQTVKEPQIVTLQDIRDAITSAALQMQAIKKSGKAARESKRQERPYRVPFRKMHEFLWPYGDPFASVANKGLGFCPLEFCQAAHLKGRDHRLLEHNGPLDGVMLSPTIHILLDAGQLECDYFELHGIACLQLRATVGACPAAVYWHGVTVQYRFSPQELREMQTLFTQGVQE